LIIRQAKYRKQTIFYIVLGLICVLYFYPYVVNHYYIEAKAHADDGMYAYYTVLNNPANFAKDVFYSVHDFFINTSLIYFGTFWLVENTGIPLRIVYFGLLAVMFFALPFIYLRILKDKVEPIWLLLVFLVTLLSKFYSWNLSNHNDVDFPYRADLAIPFLYGAILLLMKNINSGYVLLVIGGLFHPAMGLYAITTVFLLRLFVLTQQRVTHLLFLSFACIFSMLPSFWMMFGSKYEHVAKSEMIKLLKSNMHFLPWESPYLWPQSIMSVTAFSLLLICCSFSSINRLGGLYRKLIVCSVVSTVIWILIHLSGLYCNIPSLIILCGMRSVTMLSVIVMPIFILYVIDSIKEGSIIKKFLSSTTLTIMVIGKPYGLFVSIAVIMLVYELLDKYASNTTVLKCRDIIIAGVFLVWSLVLLLPFMSVETYLGVSEAASKWIMIVYKIAKIDSAPFYNGIHEIHVIAVMSVIALVLYFDKKYKKNACVYLLLVVTFFFLLVDTFKFYHRSGSPEYRDLYDAQIWAKTHTLNTDMFIVYDGSWRSFSERPVFVPRKLGYYMYKPDVAIKRYDDVVYWFYNIQNPYDTYSNSELSKIVSYKYDALTDNDFLKLAKLVGAKYLVDRKYINLPIVYMNNNYIIYYVGS